MGTLELFDITRYVSEKNVEILRGGIYEKDFFKYIACSNNCSN